MIINIFHKLLTSKLYYYIIIPWNCINVIFSIIFYILFNSEKNETQYGTYIMIIFSSIIDLIFFIVLIYIISKDSEVRGYKLSLRIWSLIGWIKLYIINFLINYDLLILLLMITFSNMIVMLIHMIIVCMIIFVGNCKKECRKVFNDQ